MPTKREKPTVKPTTHKLKPTERQKKVLKSLMDNECSVGSLKKILIKAGYSPNYAHNPQNFRKTATWQELLDENLPDWLLTEKHLGLLNAQAIDHYVFSPSTPDEEIKELIEGKWGFKVMKISHGDTWKRAYFSIPDNAIILKAVEAGYKIKNRYEPEEVIVHRKLEDLSDEEIEKLYDAKVRNHPEK
jgi:hypothetical protein